MRFPTAYLEILQRMENIDPIRYGSTRSFINGAVTYLSPYISRGVISTKMVLNHVMNKGFQSHQILKFVQELAWGDYFQQVWVAKGVEIDQDLLQPQENVAHHLVPTAIAKGQTSINAIDEAIANFYKTGYIHNHVRMYIASLACNIGQSHWKNPARWMYYHLLDGNWASNALSWQWVAGTNSSKKYFANQENINRYCYSEQRSTYLDIRYEELTQMDIPEKLLDCERLELRTSLPEVAPLNVHATKPTLIYNYYNLDPTWRSQVDVNRVFLIEPSHFEAYPVSSKSLEFAIELGSNIPNLQLFVGEFEELKKTLPNTSFIYKEHPLNKYYEGTEDPRDWMFSTQGYYPSFFAFWKRCSKEWKEMYSN